jgi:hypothetical protein
MARRAVDGPPSVAVEADTGSPRAAVAGSAAVAVVGAEAAVGAGDDARGAFDLRSDRRLMAGTVAARKVKGPHATTRMRRPGFAAK